AEVDHFRLRPAERGRVLGRGDRDDLAVADRHRLRPRHRGLRRPDPPPGEQEGGRSGGGPPPPGGGGARPPPPGRGGGAGGGRGGRLGRVGADARRHHGDEQGAAEDARHVRLLLSGKSRILAGYSTVTSARPRTRIRPAASRARTATSWGPAAVGAVTVAVK